MTSYTIRLENLTKTFARRVIFKSVNLEFNSPNVIGVTGPNGSGKSTLVKIIAGLLSPTKGQVMHLIEGKRVLQDNIHKSLGYVAPYLILYDEFTGQENVNLNCEIRGIIIDQEQNDRLFKHLSLFERKDDPVKAYSSGMKQRLRFIFSLIHHPALIILDEPTSNLDSEGKDKVYSLVCELGENNLILIASNEADELKLCNKVINLKEL